MLSYRDIVRCEYCSRDVSHTLIEHCESVSRWYDEHPQWYYNHDWLVVLFKIIIRTPVFVFSYLISAIGVGVLLTIGYIVGAPMLETLQLSENKLKFIVYLVVLPLSLGLMIGFGARIEARIMGSVGRRPKKHIMDDLSEVANQPTEPCERQPDNSPVNQYVITPPPTLAPPLAEPVVDTHKAKSTKLESLPPPKRSLNRQRSKQ